MQAVVFDAVGVPETVLTVREIPKPVPARGEVLVRMIAAPVNPSDLMYVQGIYGLKPTLPATPGFEGVGVVEATGGGVLGMLRKGKRVAVISNRVGTWAEYTVTSARQVVPMPDDISDEQAASFFVNPVTVVAMIEHVLKVQPGETLLQNAAASELGKMIIRLGKASGFKTINVVRRREAVEELRRLGADHVIVEGESLPQDVKYALDPVGGESGSAIARCLAKLGRMLCYGALSGEPTRVDPRTMITNSASVEGFWLSNWAKEQGVLTMLKTFRRVKDLYRAGVFTTTIAKSYPLTEVKVAVSHAAQANRGGKVLLKMAG